MNTTTSDLPTLTTEPVYRVLLVDDQKLVGMILQRMLADQPDIIFEFCRDANAALATAEAFRPTVILQDRLMDKIDGFEMVQRYRGLPATASVPVIMLSSTEDGAVKAHLLESGANDYLVKPPSQVELIARIRVHSDAYLRRLERDAAFKALEVEREKSERLLLNILPAKIAERLKHTHQTIADSYPEVTVLFTDLCGFTQFSQTVDAHDLVNLLDDIFSTFDTLAAAHGVEKIKTIGDAYMAAAGIPVARADHAEASARMALALQADIERFNRAYSTSIHLRIGLSSGPVVAGVIGRRKFTFDLWGDTVNLAFRLESLGTAGSIQVSEATYERLKHKFRFDGSRCVQIKGRGEENIYTLVGSL